MLSRLRALTKQADPEVVEEWKWRGTPVWSHDGVICTGETYKNVVKMTFLKGASLKDPSGLFNASLEGNKWRAIDFHKGDQICKSIIAKCRRAHYEGLFFISKKEASTWRVLCKTSLISGGGNSHPFESGND